MFADNLVTKCFQNGTLQTYMIYARIHIKFIDKVEYIATHILDNHHVMIVTIIKAHKPIRYSWSTNLTSKGREILFGIKKHKHLIFTFSGDLGKDSEEYNIS